MNNEDKKFSKTENKNTTVYFPDSPSTNITEMTEVEKVDSAVDFLKDTPYSANKGFTPSPMNTPEQFAATEVTPSNKVGDPIVDFLKGSPYEVLKDFKPSPMPTPEQFEATAKGLSDAAKQILKIRSQASEASPSTDSNNKP